MRGKHQKPETLLCPSFFRRLFIIFRSLLLSFSHAFCFIMLMCVEAGHCLRVRLREGFEGRMDRQQDGSGGASKCTGCRGAACRSRARPRAGIGTQQPWSRELCPAACSCSRRSWALPWWWARELAASAKVNLCWSVMVRLKHSKVVRAVEIKML